MPSYGNLSIEKLCRKITKGIRMINVAQAGMGKSTMMCQIAKRWMEQKQMSNTNELTDILRFKQVYLIPVRLIHNHRETLERIITHDLNLLGHDKEGDVRRQLKFNSSDVLYLIDGYDEMSKKERNNSTIEKLLSGEVAPNAAAIATTRPHCLEYLKQCVTAGTVITKLLELDNQVVKTILQSRFPNDNPDMLMKLLEDVPGDIYRIPFFFTVLCYVWKRRKASTVTSREHHFSRVTDIMDAMWGLMLGLKKQKEEGFALPEFYKSFRDKRLGKATQRLITSLAKLCFEIVKCNKSTFSDKQLEDYKIGLEELGKFGILRVDPVGESHSFVHKLFIEHCAALHLVGANVNISELLGYGGLLNQQSIFENVLLFAVGMESDMLNKVKDMTHVLHMIGGALEINEVDLSFHTRLLRECKDATVRNVYCEHICRLPVRKQYFNKQEISYLPRMYMVSPEKQSNHVIYGQMKKIQSSIAGSLTEPDEQNIFRGDIYASFLRQMGVKRSLNLLQSANPSDISYRNGRTTLWVPNDHVEVFVMTPLLLATLLATDLTEIPRLIIGWCNPNILELTKAWAVSYHGYNNVAKIIRCAVKYFSKVLS